MLWLICDTNAARSINVYLVVIYQITVHHNIHECGSRFGALPSFSNSWFCSYYSILLLWHCENRVYDYFSATGSSGWLQLKDLYKSIMQYDINKKTRQNVKQISCDSLQYSHTWTYNSLDKSFQSTGLGINFVLYVILQSFVQFA